MSSLSFNCGQKIIPACVGAFPSMDDAGWEALFGEISSDAMFAIKFVVMTMG